MKPAIDRDRAITTERLVLRPVETGDIPTMVDALSDFSVIGKLSQVPHPYTAADGAAFVAFANDAATDGLHLAIALEGGLIGIISLRPFPDGELGYWLARDHWGKGYMTEAAAALLADTFARAPDTIVESSAFTDNPASLRVQEKLGFRQVGTASAYSLSRQSTDPQITTRLTHADFLKATDEREDAQEEPAS